jgi:serine/threonine-protein kinase
MAIVYLGHDAHLGRKVAIKLLPPELTFGSSTQVIERFKREARTAATLDHPNIIPVHRVSTGGKLFWYVMKYLEGEALDEILEREGQLAVDRTADIVRQVADALDYAHEKNVVHRDVKPANVMLDAKARVTVTDFGIAKALDANTLTASGAMIGTPYYMSPEQCSGKRVGPASDQYSLAVMTYQMLGGHVPFTGDSVVDIIRKHVMDPVPPLGVLRPKLPEAVVAVVERGLSKAPSERFTNCAEFARALDAAAQGFDVTLAPPSRAGRGPRLSKTALVSPVPGALRTAKGTLRSRSRGLALAIGAGVVVLAGGLVVWRPWGARPVIQEREGTVPVALAGADTLQPPAAPATAGDTALPSDTVPSARADTAAGARPAEPEAATPASRPARRRPAPAATAPGRAQPVAPQQVAPQREAQPGQPAPAQPPPAAGPAQPTMAYISLGTQPRSTIYVNGQPAPRYPLVNFAVPPGLVRLRFQVTDSSGIWWARDRAITVPAGDTMRLGFIRLERP